MAKGKISKRQSESILRIYDRGMQGELRDAENQKITKVDFSRALKVLVMHHYLFEPSNVKAEPVLQIRDKRRVFQNIALSEFDLLLCGHKHIAEVQMLAYLDHFDPRAKIRLAFNLVRRSLGLNTLPIPPDENGRILSRMYRFLLGIIYLQKTGGASLTDRHVDDIVRLLEQGLETPNLLKDEIRNFLREKGSLGEVAEHAEVEIRELHSRIVRSLTPEKARKLRVVAKSLRSILDKLGGRPFVQISSASSAKASEPGGRTRAMNTYDVVNVWEQRTYTVTTKRYSWGGGNFSEPIVQTLEFPFDRIHS
jgi:hypothetical protein